MHLVVVPARLGSGYVHVRGALASYCHGTSSTQDAVMGNEMLRNRSLCLVGLRQRVGLQARAWHLPRIYTCPRVMRPEAYSSSLLVLRPSVALGQAGSLNGALLMSCLGFRVCCWLGEEHDGRRGGVFWSDPPLSSRKPLFLRVPWAEQGGPKRRLPLMQIDRHDAIVPVSTPSGRRRKATKMAVGCCDWTDAVSQKEKPGGHDWPLLGHPPDCSSSLPSWALAH
jgi:hypothetical protein